MPRGRFITFEGGEGTGKSTQVRLLAQALEKAGLSVVTTREPGGSPGAEAIRDFLLAGHAEKLGPFAEALLFAAARIDHLRATIRPALEQGRWVLCDRFADSTRVYQGNVGQIDQETLATLERIVLAGARPDLTIILDVPAETGLARAAARRGRGEKADRFEKETLAFHEAVRSGFLGIAEAEPERCVVVATDKEPGQVHAEIMGIVRQRLPLPEDEPRTDNSPGNKSKAGAA